MKTKSQSILSSTEIKIREWRENYYMASVDCWWNEQWDRRVWSSLYLRISKVRVEAALIFHLYPPSHRHQRQNFHVAVNSIGNNKPWWGLLGKVFPLITSNRFPDHAWFHGVFCPVKTCGPARHKTWRLVSGQLNGRKLGVSVGSEGLCPNSACTWV